MNEQELRQEIENLKAELNLSKAETALAKAEAKRDIAILNNEMAKLKVASVK